MKESGKSLIYLAIDNQHPEQMLKAFLSGYLWRADEIDQDYNIITIGNYRYSPETYVEKHQRPHSLPDTTELLAILRQRANRRVYYALEGPQPPDACGLPPEVEKETLRQQQIAQQEQEEDMQHQKRLQRELEAEIQCQSIGQQRHKLKMTQAAELGKQQREEAQANSRIKLELETKEAVHRRHIVAYDRNAEREHLREIESLETTALENKNRLRLDYHQKVALTEQKSLEAKASVERRTMKERDTYREREHDRKITSATAIAAAAAQMAAQSTGLPAQQFRGYIEE